LPPSHLFLHDQPVFADISGTDINVVLIVSDPMLKEYVIEFRCFIPPTRQISGNDALRVNYRRPFSLDSSTRFAFCCAKNPDRRRQLIPEFSSVLTKYPQLSLLLAVEAAKVQQPFMEYGWLLLSNR
jgi:hypothetical protein